MCNTTDTMVTVYLTGYNKKTIESLQLDRVKWMLAFGRSVSVSGNRVGALKISCETLHLTNPAYIDALNDNSRREK